MQIRDYSLPEGWYPRDPVEACAAISHYLMGAPSEKASSRAAISPHAGWYYCGRIAAKAAASLEKEAETIVILGGHLPAGSPALFAMEDAVKTPFGPMPIDRELRAVLKKEFNGAEDKYRDNTVEVLMPMVRFFFPQANLLWVRLPADTASFEAGKTISQTAEKLKRKINVLASSDLTHYGVNYGFSPMGRGAAALHWVRETNDAAFIRAVEEGNSSQALLCAQRDSSACSAGAVLGAMGFAKASGLGKAKLLEYATSADVDDRQIPDSFVGYAAIAFG